MRSGRWTGWVVAIMLCSTGAGEVWAGRLADHRTEDRVDALMTRHNLHPAFEKLGRGVANFFLGWTEIPLNVHKRYQTSDTGSSFMTGIAHGLFKGIVRTGVGAYEAMTFFLPYPENFAPILPTLDYFQQQTKRKRLPLE